MFGTILKVVLSALGLANKVAEQVHDSSEQKAGAAEQKATDQDTALAAHQRLEEAAAQPADSGKDLGDGTF